MKERFCEPQMEITPFAIDDIITTSGAYNDGAYFPPSTDSETWPTFDPSSDAWL